MAEVLALPSLLETDLYVATLEAAAAPGTDDLALLTPRELARAGRYRFPWDRARYVASRALLRRLLARYTALLPEAIAIEVEERGRPYVRGGPAFSISHSGRTVVIGVRAGGRVGVDVESLDQRLAPNDLAGRFFSPQEAAFVAARDGADATRGFLQLWTLKEAYLKALGIGLLGDLTKCPFELDGEPRLATPHGNWAFRSFEPEYGFIAALAVTPDS